MTNKIDPNVKRAVLKSIRENQYDVKQLETALASGVTIQEMLDNQVDFRLLEEFDDDLLSRHIRGEEGSFEALVDFGLSDSKLATLSRLIDETSQHNHPIPDDSGTQGEGPLGTKEQIYLGISNSLFSAEDIRTFLLEGKVSPQELIDRAGLSQEMLSRIKSYSRGLLRFPENIEDLPQIEPDRTDVYFFGTKGSGKSCILAGFLSNAVREGLVMGNMGNPFGTGYQNQLVNDMSRGILPRSTPTDYINYIPIGLRNPEKLDNIHPINLIEMSGELIDKVSEDGVDYFNKVKDYLANNNRKVFAFIIDYNVHKQNADGMYVQGQRLTNVLTVLRDFGILQETDAMYIIVSKADKFPGGADPGRYMRDFLNTYYRNFINNCLAYKKKFEFSLVAIPFSIGPSILQDLLVDYRPESNMNLIKYPRILTEQIVYDAFLHNTAEGLDKTFK